MILGETRARPVGQWLMILFYPLTLLAVVVGWSVRGSCWSPWPSRGSSSVLRIFRAAEAGGPPDWYPARGWPLWFVGFAFVHARRAGGLLTLGLLLNALLPMTLPWL